MGKTTENLENVLLHARLDEMDGFLSENESRMLKHGRNFTEFMRAKVKEKGLLFTDIYRNANISERYGAKIISMEKHTKDRGLIIRLCIASKLTFDETQHALTLYGFAPLYAKNPQDAVVINAIANGISNVYDVEELLIAHSLDTLENVVVPE